MTWPASLRPFADLDDPEVMGQAWRLGVEDRAGAGADHNGHSSRGRVLGPLGRGAASQRAAAASDGHAGRDLTPSIEDRAVAIEAALADRGQHRGPSIPDLLNAATAELAKLTVLYADQDYELVAGITGQPVERLRLS